MSPLMDSIVKESDNGDFDNSLHYIIWNCHFYVKQLNIGNFIWYKLIFIECFLCARHSAKYFTVS